MDRVKSGQDKAVAGQAPRACRCRLARGRAAHRRREIWRYICRHG